MEWFLGLFQLAAVFTFLGLFMGRTWQLRARGIQVVNLVRGKPWREAALEALFLLTFPLWLVDVLWHAWPRASGLAATQLDPVLFAPGWLPWLGLLVQLLSVGIFAWSLRSFGNSWRVGVDHEAPGALVTAGIFGLSRNPIFLSMDLLLVGSVLLTGRLVPVLFALGAVVGFHRQIVNEERFLAAKYGAAYRRYRSRVARYWGRPSAGRASPRCA